MFLHGLAGLWLQKHGWRLQPGSEKVLHSGTRLEGDEPTRDKMSVTTRFVHGVTRFKFIALLSTSYDAFHNAHNVDMLLCDMSNTDIQKGTRLSIPCVLSKLKYCS